MTIDRREADRERLENCNVTKGEIKKQKRHVRGQTEV